MDFIMEMKMNKIMGNKWEVNEKYNWKINLENDLIITNV